MLLPNRMHKQKSRSSKREFQKEKQKLFEEIKGDEEKERGL